MDTARPTRPSQPSRWRVLLPALGDCIAWGIGLTAVLLLRVDVPGYAVRWDGLQTIIPIACALQLVAGLVLGLYQVRWRIGSFEELAALIAAMLGTTAAVFVVNLLLERPVPGSVPLGAGVIALASAGAARYAWRLRRERSLRPHGDRARRLLVFGAGDAGTEVVTRLLRTPESPYVPVAFLDDDPAKRNLRIRGVPVLGGRAELERVVAEVQSEVLLVATPGAPTSLLRELAQRAEATGMALRVLPSLPEILSGEGQITDIRPLAEAELIGRAPARIDESQVAGAIANRHVLVTGAGGSIGSELCRQISRFGPAELVMLDRDESALHSTELVLRGHARLDTPDLVVADLRDKRRVFDVFDRARPELVFHAAALKHLPLLELHPQEAVKTNVRGTEHVLLAALEVDVARLVNISTDKAADPISVLGYTKRLTERLTSWASTRSNGTFLSVRFGNVLGSRGSILSTFQSQIASGGPVTVTDPEVTRFFMTGEEAAQLVLQAAVVGRDGEALVLDMGDPVAIRRLAERLVAAAPRHTEIIYTGLRRGEKLHETLLGADEADERPFHPLLVHVPVPPLEPGALDGLDDLAEDELPRALADLCVRDESEVRPPSPPAVGYLLIDGTGSVVALDARMRGPAVDIPALASTASWDAQRADGTSMPPDEYPPEVTRRTGRALEDVVCNVRRADGQRAWVSISTSPVSSTEGGVLVAIREIPWDPDPARPEVIDAMRRVARSSIAHDQQGS